MKHFRIEPTYKKSVIERTMFKRPLSDLTDEGKENQWAYLEKELGWRWGSFMISVPDTQEEMDEYLKEAEYDNLFDFASDHGCTYYEDDVEKLPEDFSILDVLLPSTNDDWVDLTEDYPDAEMIECWDGCWEDWTIRTGGPKLSDTDEMMEEIEEAYSEEYEEGVEELGWTFVDNFFEIHCKVTVTPCDETGNVFEEEKEQEQELDTA